MTAEALDRLRPDLDLLVGYLCQMSGTTSYEDAITALRVGFHDKRTSPAAWLHRVAEGLYPAAQQNSVDPEMFYEILGLISTREQFDAALASLPDESVPQIQKFLIFVLKDYLPSQKVRSQALARMLPQRRSGGAKPKMPDKATRNAICKKIASLVKAGVPKGDAQRRAVGEFGIKLRMIQTIWAERDNSLIK